MDLKIRIKYIKTEKYLSKQTLIESIDQNYFHYSSLVSGVKICHFADVNVHDFILFFFVNASVTVIQK